MNEPDFSGIDPLRVPEARRRVAAIERYLDIGSPSNADAVRISAEVGLSRWQLQRLARIWREHRDPSMMVVAKRGPSTRDYGLDPRAVLIAKAAIREGGADAELSQLAPLIEDRCRAEGVAPPSRPTLWNYIRAARVEAGPAREGRPRIVMGRMWFRLPVSTPAAGASGVDMPMLLAAIALPEGKIIGHRISTEEGRPPMVGELVAEVLGLSVGGAEPRPLLLEAGDRRAAASVLATRGLGDLRAHNRSVQRQISRAFGGRLGPLPALYRHGFARQREPAPVRRQEERLSAGAASEAILHAVAANNASARTVPDFSITAAACAAEG